MNKEGPCDFQQVPDSWSASPPSGRRGWVHLASHCPGRTSTARPFHLQMGVMMACAVPIPEVPGTPTQTTVAIKQEARIQEVTSA